jgi:hypothetical protein
MSDAKIKAEAIASIERALTSAGILSFSGETQLWGWGKSTHNTSPWVKLALHDDDAMLPFEAATVRKGKTAGQLYWILAIRLDEDERPTHHQPKGGDLPARTESVETTDHTRADTTGGDASVTTRNMLAYEMHRSGWFRNPALWNAMHDAGLYTLQEHKEFVQNLACFGPNVIAPGFCSGDRVAHHCNAAHLPAAGRARQPEAPQKEPHWYTVALCHAHHQWVHTTATKDHKDELLTRAIEVTASQIKAAIKEAIGIESMAHLTDEQLVGFLNLIELPQHAWPSALKERIHVPH